MLYVHFVAPNGNAALFYYLNDLPSRVNTLFFLLLLLTSMPNRRTKIIGSVLAIGRTCSCSLVFSLTTTTIM